MKINITLSIDAPIEDEEQLEWLKDCLEKDLTNKDLHITSTGRLGSCLDHVIDGDVYEAF